jgi:hypothetical protein
MNKSTRILSGAATGNDASNERKPAFAAEAARAYHESRVEHRPNKAERTAKARERKLQEPSLSDLYPHWVVKPWPEPVDTARLLETVIDRIKRHVVLTKDHALACALWLMMSWVHEEAATHSPILLATSPEPECGKSTLIGVLGYQALRSLLTVSISGPALFRSIEKWHPTFAIDEADAAFAENEDLRAVANSGWTRGQGVIRCDPKTNEPRRYGTFCPKIIGLKGKKPPDTLMSRAIVIEMQRKKLSEQVEDFDHLDDQDFQVARQQLLRWAVDHAAILKKATPASPPGFQNRRAANWRLLFAIAELAGGDWKNEAWKAAATIEKVKSTLRQSMGLQALSDIRELFEMTNSEALLSKDIVEKLSADPEKPWAEYSRGRPISQKGLSTLLNEYAIYSETIHPPGMPHGKGYKRFGI